MPLLRFYGVGLPVVRVFARELTETLAKVVQCPQDWFHLEVVDTKTVNHLGEEMARSPVRVDLVWFSRGQDTQDKVAECVTTTLRQHLPDQTSDDITVVATAVEKHDYYENGKHF